MKGKKSKNHQGEKSTLEIPWKKDPRFFDVFFTKAPLTLCVLDKNLDYVKLNPSLLKIHGLPEKEFLGKNLIKMAPSASASGIKKLEQKLKKVLKTGNPIIQTKSIQFLKSHFQKRYWIISIFRVEIEKKKFLMLVGTEITELKKNEKEWKNQATKLKEVNKNLLESKAKHKALLQSMEQGVLVLDKEGKIINMNKKAEEILEVKLPKIAKKDFDEVMKATDEEGALISREKRPFFTVLKTGKPAQRVYWLTTYRHKKIPISLAISPLIVKGKIIGVVEVFREITADLKNERAKSEFVSIAAHQLRTPLAIFNWYNERLLGGELGPLNKAQHEYLTKAQNTVKNMVELVEVFLNVSKIELGTFTLNPMPVDALTVAQNVLSEFHHELTERNIHLIKAYEPYALTVNVDLSLIKMALQNLLSNAVKYTSSGGSIKLNIYEETKNNAKKFLRIEVSDTGIGIPQNQQSKIFQKLFRADNAKIVDPSGVGLGLYVLKSIIEKANGKIWFESPLKTKGPYKTTFYIEIPLKKI